MNLYAFTKQFLCNNTHGGRGTSHLLTYIVHGNNCEGKACPNPKGGLGLVVSSVFDDRNGSSQVAALPFELLVVARTDI